MPGGRRRQVRADRRSVLVGNFPSPPIISALTYVDPAAVLQYCRADLGVALNGSGSGDPIESWGDFSGNGKHYSQGTEAFQPIWYSDGGTNDQAFLDFDTTAKWLQSALTLPAAGTAPTTIWLIAKMETWSANRRILTDSVVDLRHIVYQQGTTPEVDIFNASSVGNNTGAILGLTKRYIAFFGTAGNCRIKIGGTDVGSLSPGSVNTSADRTIGSDVNTSAIMEVYEILYMNRALTAQEESDLDAYAELRYGELAVTTPPAAPTLTAPSDNDTLFIGSSVTVSATSTDGDLDRIDWVLNPGGSEIIVATDSAAAYSQTWVIAQAVGAHTLVARAVRGISSTDSAPIDLTLANPTLMIETFLADGTWTSPAAFMHPDGTYLAAAVECWGAGGGGTADTGGGGGGGYSLKKVTGLAASTGYAAVVGVSAINTNGEDTTFDTTVVVAKGGLSGGNGGTGGAAASGTGDTKTSGGNGALGTGNRAGGGGGGSSTSGSGATAGAPEGGFGASANVGAQIAAGGGSTAAAGIIGSRGEVRVAVEVAAAAGFPRVRKHSYGRSTADGTSHSVTMPASITAGNLLVLLVVSDGIPTISVSGWTGLTQVNEGTSQVCMNLFYKTAAGSDTATISLTSSEGVAYEVIEIAGAGTPTWTTASGNSTNANPPSHTVSSAKYLWLAVGGWDVNAYATITGYPANYTSAILQPPALTTGVQLMVCERLLESTNQDPGTFTSTTEQWVAATVSIPPA